MNTLKRPERCRTSTLCCGYTGSFNFPERCVYLRTGTAEQESSQLPLCRENNFVVSLCLRLTDLITLFFFIGFRLKPQLCLGFRVSESFSTGCSWTSRMDSPVKKPGAATGIFGTGLTMHTTKRKGLSGWWSQENVQLVMDLLHLQPTPK